MALDVSTVKTQGSSGVPGRRTGSSARGDTGTNHTALRPDSALCVSVMSGAYVSRSGVSGLTSLDMSIFADLGFLGCLITLAAMISLKPVAFLHSARSPTE
jgi:hypothetical protein